MNVNFSCNTGGTGLYSKRVVPVRIEELLLDSQNEYYGELQVIFNVNDWDVRTPEDNFFYEFIYTDKTFLNDLKENLMKLGFSSDAVNDIGYSEYGMQGINYVSFDVGNKFVTEYSAKNFNEEDFS